MKLKKKWKLLSLLLVVSMILGPFSGLSYPTYAKEKSNSTIIASDKMSVEVADDFPRVIQYEWGETGKLMYGQEEEIHELKINEIAYQPEVTSESSGDRITYTLDFSATELGDVQMEIEIQVQENILEMKVTEIKDPGLKVRYIEFPNQGLISIRSTQDGAAMAYNSNFVNQDTYSSVADKSVDASPVRIGHVFLYTNELAASIESDMTCQYNYIQTVQKEGYKKTSVWNTDFMYRGPDKSVTELPWTKVVITDDINQDGQVNWQDSAVAYRDIMDPMIGENLAQQTIGVNILLNYWGRQSWTWENGLDYVKRQALATDDFPQIMLVKGSHRQYGDGWPSYADQNPLLGGNDQFRWLIEEGSKHNIYVGSHTNSVEAYPESPYYSTTPKYNGGVWDLVDRGGTAVDDIAYWSEGILPQRYEAHKQEFQNMKFQYLDVSAGRWDGKEARWTTYKTLQKFKEMDWTYFTEMYKGYVDYTLNDPTTKALSPKYVSWCHTYYFGEESNGGNHGDSDIRRFIINDQAIYEAGNKEYQDVLGPGYQKSYGYLGWSESQTTVTGAVDEFWQHTLADTYLKNFQILSINKDENNNIKAKLKDGVQSVFDGTSRTISKDGVIYGVLNDNHQELFMPWNPKEESKIYTYSTSGGTKEWTLPKSWANVSSIQLFQLSQTDGRTFVSEIPVVDGKVTISYEAGQGYVVTKENISQTPVVWGDGSIIKDGNFNSNNLDVWAASNTDMIEVKTNSKNDNRYLNISGEAEVTQEITGLETGKSYVISALVTNDGDRAAELVVQQGDESQVSSFTGNNSITVMDNMFNGWSQIKVYFTAASTNGTVVLKALDGSGNILLDDIRIYEEANPYGANGHYYYDDFETSHTMGGFVHENSSLARLSYANNGVNEKASLNGDMSIMMGGRNDSKIKTLPGLLKFEPDTGYDLSFVYKSSYGPANGWRYMIISESTGEILVNKFLSSYDGEVVTEQVSFKTGNAQDYILVIENKYAKTANQADLIFDDLTIDINDDITENGPLDPENPEMSEKVYFEAEDAKLSDGLQIYDVVEASSEKVVGDFATGTTIAFPYMSGADKLVLKYSNNSEETQTMKLFINGEESQEISFEATGGELIEKEVPVSIPNAATIQFESVNAQNIQLDYIIVNPIYEAENADKNGYTGEISDEKASGSKFVWMNDGGKQGTRLEFEIKSAATSIIIRHTNEKSSNRYLDIYVNGELRYEKLVFEPTGPKYTFADVTLELPLKKGDILSLKAPVGETEVAMIDCVSTTIDENSKVKSVTLDKHELVLAGETNDLLTATVEPANAFNGQIIWTSSDESVVRVKDGLLTPIGVGQSTITVATVDGSKSDTCEVEVRALPARYMYEAEEGTRSSSAYTTGTTTSAAGEKLVWLNSVNWSTGVIEEASYTYTINEDGESIILRYANQLSNNRVLDIYVNDELVYERLQFKQTGSSIVCDEMEIPLTLSKGDKLSFKAPWGERDVVMIDKFYVMKGVNKQELLDKLIEVKAIEQGNYTDESYEALQLVIAEVEAFLPQIPNEELLMEEIEKLNSAVEQLVEREEPNIDFKPLEDKIAEAKELEQGEHSDEEWKLLHDAISEAEKLLNTATTDDEIRAGVEALDQAIKTFKGEEILDKTILIKKIAEAEAFEEIKYTDESYAILKAAIQAAKEALLTVETEEDVIQEVIKLQEAMDQLVENPEELDKSALESKLKEAKEIDKELYTNESYKVLQEAIKKAEKDLITITTQEELETAVTQLQNAIDQLVKKATEIDTSLLEAILAKAKAITQEGYTKESFDQLQTVIAAAEAVLSNPESDLQVSEATESVRKAIEQLVPEVIEERVKTLQGDGITIEGLKQTDFKKGTKVRKEISAQNVVLPKNKEMVVLYDIYLAYHNAVVPLEGSAKVSLSLPNNIKGYKELEIVYVNKDGEVEVIKSDRADDVISFTTDHFSLYGIVGVNHTDSGNGTNGGNKTPQPGTKPGGNGAVPTNPSGTNKPGGTSSGGKTSPKTGDQSPIILLSVLMIGSVTTLSLIYLKRRQRK